MFNIVSNIMDCFPVARSKGRKRSGRWSRKKKKQGKKKDRKNRSGCNSHSGATNWNDDKCSDVNQRLAKTIGFNKSV